MEDSFDFERLWKILWERKLIIVAATSLFAFVALLYAMALPNVYRSELVLAPSQSDRQGGLAGLAAQYGGLAAIAGFNIGSADGTKVDHAIEFSRSWHFLEMFIDKNNLAPDVLAVDEWDPATRELRYDDKVFDPLTNKWINAASGETYSSWKAYTSISSMIDIEKSKESGLIVISVEHYSPDVAFEWVILLKKEINSYYQKQDMLEAQKNIAYLKEKIKETEISEMQNVFFKMIESQTKTLMLAEVGDQYLLKTVVPAKVAERKSGPARLVLVILGALLGALCSIFAVAIIDIFKS